jgi:zona occludens toxin (predicted ATPase)
MTRSFIAPALALTALASATAAQAQQKACVNPADLSDAVAYVMPIAFDAARTTCANRLAKDGFVAVRGEEYIASFREGQDTAWPGAFRFIKTFMDKEGGGDAAGGAEMQAMLTSMPDFALRPFVDALVGQMIAGEIKGDSCAKIERGLELLSPLPRDNVGGLIAFIVELTDLKHPPPMCPAQKSGTRK